MNAALVDWIPAETPYARVPVTKAPALPNGEAAREIEAAIKRVRKFEEEILRGAEDRPLMIVDRP